MSNQVATLRDVRPRAIESISDEKTICGIRYVKVGWKDVPFYASTWEPLHEIRKEKAYQAILRSKGLLFDEHSNKLSVVDKSTPYLGKQSDKFVSKTKSSKLKGKFKKCIEETTSQAEQCFIDEDSTSINDLRGLGAESREGFLTPVGKQPIAKFTPYVTSKNRLTTKFYRDLAEYYRRCQGDSPPSPLVEKNSCSQCTAILPSQDTQASEFNEVPIVQSRLS